MKKYLVVFFLMFTFIAISGQTLIVNSIGLQGENGAGDFDISQNEDVTIAVNYTVSGLARNNVKGYSFDGNDGQILLSFYNSATPNEGNWEDEKFITVSFPSSSVNGTHTVTSSFNIGSFTTNTVSIQAYLQLYTRNGVYSASHSSYQADSYYETSVPTGTPATGFSQYLTVFADNATVAPSLFTPASPSVSTFDNSSLLIDFQLSEAPLAGSVKLYFSPNSDGSSPSTTLTMASSLENINRHQITLDATNFSTASSSIQATLGNTSLTHLNTYYVAIGYQDQLGNAEAKSTWHKLVYDNAAIKPSNISANTASGSNFNLNFTLGEDSATDGIIIYIKDSSTLSLLSTVYMSGTYLAGNNSVTLNGSDIYNSANVLDVTDLNTLYSGDSYKFNVKMTDKAGNTNTSVVSAAFQYLNNNITISAIANEYNAGNALLGYDSASFQPIGYVGLKTDSGIASLSSIEFIVSGTIDANDASYLALYESPNTGFSGATQISNSIPFSGIGNYNFSIVDESLTDVYQYYFVAISLNSSGLTSSDHIEISTNDALITTSGTVSTFSPGVFADKYLYRTLIVNYFDNFPAIVPGSSDAPFFRLDIKTNQGTSAISSLQLALTGSLTSNDVVTNGFKVWESSSTTFDPSKAKATQIGGSANYNSTLEFSSFNSSISTSEKYYYFTVSTTETANTEATIGGDILSSSYIGTAEDTNVEADENLNGFPLSGDQQTLPVELTAFSGIVLANNNVKLEWTVESESGLAGYYLLRGSVSDLAYAEKIPVLIPSINTNQTYTYSFIDSEFEMNDVSYYWLQTIELSNESEYFGPAMVTFNNPGTDIPEITLDTKLYSNYPNPFNPSTNISFSVASPQKVTIQVYNIRGQLVKSLFDEYVTDVNSKHSVVWNGMDRDNKNVASGIYYAKMVAGKYKEFKKMLLIK